MTEVIFAFDEGNYRQCQQHYRGEKNQEYYLGDYTIEGGSVIDVRAEKTAVGSCSVIRLCSRSRLLFTRAWAHIQQDATDVFVLWFVLRGGLSIDNHAGRLGARAGDFALTQSLKPFSIACETDNQGWHEVLHVIGPAHEFRAHVSAEIRATCTIGAGRRDLALAQRLLAEIFAGAGELSPRTERSLLGSALALVADAIRAQGDCMAARPSLRETRLGEVFRHIDLHLSDPNLSAAAVAAGCGISPRYLSALLKENGTPLSRYVWDKRVRVAASWLSTSRPEEISIAEIGFRVGFKSPAHFSRKFKRVFGAGPRAYRAACLQRAAEEQRAGTGPPAHTAGRTLQ